MRLSMADGATYALMVGTAEVYFLADAIRLGASAFELALVVGLPLACGALGPLLALRRLSRARSRKPLVVGAALGQALILAALGLVDLAGAASPASLIGLICLYQICAQGAGTGWASWYGDLVPREVRGRYFSRRTRLVHLSTCIGMLTGGLLLDRLEPGPAGDALSAELGGAGFGTLFLVAAAYRLFSALLLAASPEGPFRGVPDRMRVERFLRTQRGTGAWRLVLLVGSLQFFVYLASAYFAPFMLGELRLDYLEYTAANLWLVIVKVALLPLWGRWIDQYGPRSILALALVLVALVPLPWVFASGLGLVLVAQTLSGISWSGFEVSNFALLLDSGYRRTRLHLFAAQSIMNGGAQLAGSLTGAMLLPWIDGGYRVLFLASCVGRMVVALAMPAVVPPARGAPGIGRGRLALRMVGIRPGGGPMHRPVEEGDIMRETPRQLDRAAARRARLEVRGGTPR